MKIEPVVDATGIPVGIATDAAGVPDVALGPAALAAIPPEIAVPDGVPVIADRASDSDGLRRHLAEEGFTLIAPHRKNRTAEPTNDGRKMRRDKRRWKVERTFAWLHSYRRTVTRFERCIGRFDGFVSLACAFIALNKLL